MKGNAALSVSRIAQLATALCAALGIALTWIGMVEAATAPVGIRTHLKLVSYFTILTNGMVAIWCALAPAGKEALPRRPGLARLALLACITIVGLVYHFLLRELWSPTGALLAGNILCHYVVPLAFVGGWLLLDRKGRLRFSYVVPALAVPAAYLVWAYALSPLVGVPYPFLDVAKLGVVAVSLWILAIFASYAVTLAIFAGIDALLAKATVSVPDGAGGE